MSTKTRGAKRRFEQSREVLDFRPNLEFIEPEQLVVPQEPVRPEAPMTMEQQIERTQELVDSYKDIELLTDIAQERIDNRVKGFTIHLDPKVDYHTIEAIKRMFPEKADPTKITYEDYRDALDCLSTHAEEKVKPLTAEDLASARQDPLKTSFVGLDLPPGLNRPELDPNNKIIEPPDLQSLQSSQIKQLLDLLTPGVNDLIKNASTGGMF